MLPGITPGVASPDYTIQNLTYRDNASDISNNAALTASSVSIGTANYQRYVLVYCHAADPGGPAGADATCTIGGVSATELMKDEEWYNTNSSWVFCRHVPTGTTATCTVTWDSSSYDTCGMTVYTFTSGAMPLFEAVDSDGATGSPTLNVNVTRGGIVLGMGRGGSTPAVSWTSPMTEHHESFYTGTSGGYEFSDASESITATEASRSIGVSISSGSSSTYRAHVVSLKPFQS
jgi:hypothetical protein